MVRGLLSSYSLQVTQPEPTRSATRSMLAWQNLIKRTVLVHWKLPAHGLPKAFARQAASTGQQ